MITLSATSSSRAVSPLRNVAPVPTPFAKGNSRFIGTQGDGQFRDVTMASGTWMGRWAWGAQFVDFNNDGLEDLFVPNGFMTNENTKDL